MTISIPQQYQSLKTKLETIVKKTTIHYGLIASNYNPTIDSTVTLTVIVTDSNGDALEGVDATVTASDGNFTQLDGTNITSASSVTGTTDSNGQFTLTYSCTEWGLITFSTNNENIQIRVNGWREVTLTDTYATLYVNGAERIAEFNYYRTNFNLSSSTTTISSGIIPTNYRPPNGCTVTLFNSTRGGNIDDVEGTFSVHTSSTGTGKTINAHAIWHY